MALALTRRACGAVAVGGLVFYIWRRRLHRKKTQSQNNIVLESLQAVGAHHQDGLSIIKFSIGDRTVQRTVVCGDAFEWLSAHSELPGSVVTSIPDIIELSYLKMGLDEYIAWFRQAAREILNRAPIDAFIMFYQTDFRRDGRWIDKSLLCSLAAEDVGAKLLFHKIVCIAPPDSVEKDRPRPRYSHLLAYSRGRHDDMQESTADVLSDRGYMTWERAMGLQACALACEYILRRTAPNRAVVVDPFCGLGTVLAVANSMGMDSVGVERNKARCRTARKLSLDRGFSDGSGSLVKKRW